MAAFFRAEAHAVNSLLLFLFHSYGISYHSIPFLSQPPPTPTPSQTVQYMGIGALLFSEISLRLAVRGCSSYRQPARPTHK